MKEKIKNQKGFIQAQILIAIIVFITISAGIGFGVVEYNKTSKIIKEAEQLAKEKKYNEAIEKLEFAQNKWVVKSIGIQKEKIFNEIEKNKKLNEDKSEYNQGIEEFNKGNWEKAKEFLSKVSEISPYYQDAKSKIEEAQNQIIKEIKEKTQKEVVEERSKRITIESQLQLERQLTEQQINELQRQREEMQLRLSEKERKERLNKALEIGNLLQDYYNEVRKFQDASFRWWTHVDVVTAHLAAYLAQHDIGINSLWPEELENKYYSYTGSHSYLDAAQKLNYIIYSPDAVNIDPADSDYEKINKILNFVRSYIHYEYDMNEIFRAPVETLWLKSGDCDDYSILVSAMLAEAGITSGIMFAANKEQTQFHAMVLFQSNETFPGFWYYSDLTSFGAYSGKWYILEPQFTLEEHSQRPEWFQQWNIVGAASVGQKQVSIWCNGQYWSPCPSGQKFICPPVGNPYCE